MYLKMRIILYDYQTEKIRSKVRKNLKKIGLHVQWSVFESEEKLDKILSAIFEEEGDYRVAIFKVKDLSGILKIGKDWEKVRFVF